MLLGTNFLIQSNVSRRDGVVLKPAVLDVSVLSIIGLVDPQHCCWDACMIWKQLEALRWDDEIFVVSPAETIHWMLPNAWPLEVVHYQPGQCVIIKMPSYRYRISHYKDNTISQPYIYSGNPYYWKDSLYINARPNQYQRGGSAHSQYGQGGLKLVLMALLLQDLWKFVVNLMSV